MSQGRADQTEGLSRTDGEGRPLRPEGESIPRDPERGTPEALRRRGECVPCKIQETRDYFPWRTYRSTKDTMRGYRLALRRNAGPAIHQLKARKPAAAMAHIHGGEK